MEIPFAGGAYETFSKNLNAQECANFYTHIDQEGAINQLSLRGTPGLKSWCDTSNYNEVRGLHVMNDRLFAVVGNTVYYVNKSAAATAASTTLDTSSGPVSMADNGIHLLIVDGNDGYVLTYAEETPTVTKIADGDFPANPMTATEQDGYFIVSVDGSGRGYISDLNDATAWTGTQYFNAEGDPDNTLSIISDHRDLIMMGEETIEFWYNSGATVPFDRKPGYHQEVGLGARYSPVKLNNTLYYLTDNFQAARLEPNPKAFSTRAIEYQMAQDSDIKNAIGMGINIEGNAFIIFTTSNNTWCFNTATNFWNKLSSYPEPFDGRWRGNCYAHFDNKHIVGDFQNGILYQWDFDTYTDNSQPIVRKRIPPKLRKDGKMIFASELEIFFEAGVGLDGGVQGYDPQAMLRYSIDGSKTWSDELWRDIGEIGNYKTRAVWYRFASGRQYDFELTISDPVKCVITGANLEATVGST